MDSEVGQELLSKKKSVHIGVSMLQSKKPLSSWAISITIYIGPGEKNRGKHYCKWY